ncbi:MAG: ABC transporter ATP-binding protein [Nitrospinae bacterium]|nr:ABC transporter ATP-binding protein [Nitrospinota bacterium]
MSRPILRVEGLKVNFETSKGVSKAVDGVSFNLSKGETLGIVGESGCGKSVTALSILRLITPPGRIVEGEVWFEDRDILAMKEEEDRAIRGKEISMIFQEPMTALNPLFKIKDQIAELCTIHSVCGREEAKERAVDMLKRVGIADPAIRGDDYPHQLSGGMRQRVVIAMALALSPKVVIADEPTTALDVTIQAQIMDLMDELKTEFDSSLILITHDLGLLAESAKDIIVMYAGGVVEKGRVTDIFSKPAHPYTAGLLESIPGRGEATGGMLKTIAGSVPNLYNLPTGCRFSNRCHKAQDICHKTIPPLEEGGEGHYAACWFAG